MQQALVTLNAAIRYKVGLSIQKYLLLRNMLRAGWVEKDDGDSSWVKHDLFGAIAFPTLVGRHKLEKCRLEIVKNLGVEESEDGLYA